MRYGRWGHLIIALSFLFSFNMVILLNYHWIDCVPSGAKKWLVILLFAFWGVLSIVADMLSKKYENIMNYDTKGDLFLQATTFYLKGNWFETECVIRKLLRNNPGDVEARLLLATLYRHTDRFVEAENGLRELSRFDNAKIWHYEILLEKIALQHARNSAENHDDPSEDPEQKEDLSEIQEQTFPLDQNRKEPNDSDVGIAAALFENENENECSGKPRLRIVLPDEDPGSVETEIFQEKTKTIPFDNQKQLLERNA